MITTKESLSGTTRSNRESTVTSFFIGCIRLSGKQTNKTKQKRLKGFQSRNDLYCLLDGHKKFQRSHFLVKNLIKINGRVTSVYKSIYVLTYESIGTLQFNNLQRFRRRVKGIEKVTTDHLERLTETRHVV